jgi:hypothetical protein
MYMEKVIKTAMKKLLVETSISDDGLPMKPLSGDFPG